jgi:lysyl-tRNA synthetase class 1
MFLEKGGKKISKSIGNVFSPQIWFRYGKPQSLVLLMLKRSEGTREIGTVDIPRYMDEVDELEDIFFDRKKVENPRELFNAKRLFEFIHWLKPPKRPGLHVPYRVMVEIARLLPQKGQIKFAAEKLKEYGYLQRMSKKAEKEIAERLRFAKNWVEDFEPKAEVKVSATEAKAIKELIEAIKAAKNGEVLQRKIFEISRRNCLKPKTFFRLVYRIILGSDRGPRLGPYIFQRGKNEVIERLEEYV